MALFQWRRKRPLGQRRWRSATSTTIISSTSMLLLLFRMVSFTSTCVTAAAFIHAGGQQQGMHHVSKSADTAPTFSAIDGPSFAQRTHLHQSFANNNNDCNSNRRSLLENYCRPQQPPINEYHNRQAEVDAIEALRKSSSIEEIFYWISSTTTTSGSSSTSNTTILTSPNVAAAALKRITQLLLQARRKNMNDAENTLRIAKQKVLPEIIQRIAVSLIDNEDDDSAPSSSMNLYATSDCLVSLSILIRVSHRKSSSSSSSTLEKLAPILLLLWRRLDDDKEKTISMLSPKRLVDCLRAISALGPSSEEISSTNLYRQICQRLSQGDAIGQLNSIELVMVLRAIATQYHHQPLASSSTRLQVLLKAATRRLRKKTVRESASRRTIVQALNATHQLWTQIRADDGNEILRREFRLMTYTLTKQLVSNNPAGHHHSDASEYILTPLEVATMFQTAAVVLEVSITTDPLVQDLYHCLEHHIQAWRRRGDFVPVVSLAQILSALERWKISFSTINEVIHGLGTVFQDYIRNESHQNRNGYCDAHLPHHVNTILRCAALLRGQDTDVMRPYLSSVRGLFVDQEFLERCTPVELSNFVWIAAFKAQRFFHNDDEVILALVHRILDDDIVEGCTPKLACRILNALTALLLASEPSHDDTAPRHFALLSDVFARLGDHLLSTQLTPLDASSAIYAYAKASYVLDMGIFDHLLEVLASKVSECTFRQASQSLWACGKMVAWECDISADGDWDVSPATAKPLPYLASATELATYLAQYGDELSTKDVAQALWAMARLKMNKAALVDPLVERAEVLASELTNQEVANIVWALSKMRRKDFRTVFVLTRRFACHATHDLIKPQEAANVLYALGKMDIRDEQVFQRLSDVILQQLDCTSAQAVANVMWAHRAVYIEPPRRLFDSWAKQKLGLVAINPRTVEYIN